MNRPMLLLAGASMALVMLWSVHWWPYTVDDSYITYRYALNTARGDGPVYNGGERVEGYSSPAWMLLLAGAILTGLDPVPVSKILGLAAALGMIALLAAALRRAGCHPWIAGAACVWLATIPTLHIYAASGMETLWFALAVSAASLGPATLPDGRGRTGVMIASLIAVVTLRPEGMLVAALLSILWLAVWPMRRTAIALGAGWGLLGSLALVRLAYYGTLLPNTFVAKPSPVVRTLAGGHVGFALLKLYASVQENLIPALSELGGTAVLLLAVAALVLRRSDPAVRSAAIAVLAGAAFIVYARSDWMLGFRFALPFAAPAIYLAAMGADALRERLLAGSGTALRRLALVSLAVLFGWCGWSTVVTAEYLSRYEHGTVNTAMNAEVYERIGRWLGGHARPGDRLLAYEVGAVAYASGIHVIDQHGLITPDVARIVQWAEGDYREIRTGKDRRTMDRIVEYCASQRPEWFLVRSVRSLPLREGDPLPAGSAMDLMQNEILLRLGDTMVLAASFQMRPDSERWKDDRYLLLRRRDIATAGSRPEHGAGS